KKVSNLLSKHFKLKEIDGKLYYILDREEQERWNRYTKATNFKSDPTKTTNGFVLEDKPNLSILREDKETGDLFYWIDFGDNLMKVKIDLLVRKGENQKLKELQDKIRNKETIEKR